MSDPFTNPELVARVLLSGQRLPGIVQTIDGAHRGFTWNIQTGTGSSGATSVFRGAKLAEEIEIGVKVVDAAGWNACVAWRKYIAPAKFGGKPPTFTIDNILVNYNEITRVSIKDIIQPKQGKGLDVDFVFKFTEYNPSVAAAAGKADPAKAAGAGKTPTPQDAAEAAITKIIADIKAV